MGSIKTDSIKWAVPQAREILMIPGPTEIPFPVIQAMNQPPVIQPIADRVLMELSVRTFFASSLVFSSSKAFSAFSMSVSMSPMPRIREARRSG